MNKNQLMKFGVWFVIAAPAVFFLFLELDLHLGYATLPVGLGGCLLVVLLIHLWHRWFPHAVRVDIDNNRRIYVNGIPYYRLVLGAIGALILIAILMGVLWGIRHFWHTYLT